MPGTMTAEERLDALAELRADLRFKLADAEALAEETGGTRSRGRGAQLSRQDAVAYKRQLALRRDLPGRMGWPQLAADTFALAFLDAVMLRLRAGPRSEALH